MPEHLRIIETAKDTLEVGAVLVSAEIGN